MMKYFIIILLALVTKPIYSQTTLPQVKNVVTYTDSIFVDSNFTIEDFYEECHVFQKGYKAKDKCFSMKTDSAKRNTYLKLAEMSNNIMYSHLLTHVAFYYLVDLYYFDGGYKYVITNIQFELYDKNYEIMRKKADIEILLNPTEENSDYLRFAESLRFAADDKMKWTIKNLNEAMMYGYPPTVHDF